MKAKIRSISKSGKVFSNVKILLKIKVLLF